MNKSKYFPSLSESFYCRAKCKHCFSKPTYFYIINGKSFDKSRDIKSKANLVSFFILKDYRTVDALSFNLSNFSTKLNFSKTHISYKTSILGIFICNCGRSNWKFPVDDSQKRSNKKFILKNDEIL